MDHHITTASPSNGASTPHELFALTDEQILEIEPENEAAATPPSATDARSASQDPSSPSTAPRNDESQAERPNAAATSHQSPVTSHDSAEPPPWLAEQMKDPWSGEEARELWNGVQQTRQEAAAYRAAFATPEDARALKELYPGGVSEARATAERAKLLETIDRAYFGVPGGAAEQTSAARADLAQRMLREDPAAFREMVFAGLRAIEAAEKGSAASTDVSNLPRLAQVFSARSAGENVTPSSVPPSEVGRAAPSPANPAEVTEKARLKPAATQDSHESPVLSHQSLVSAYTAFEKAANDDLERSVGAAIARTLEQALPNVKRGSITGAGVPLQDRLGAAIRQDVEAALKGDRQLGEQIAQILSARRFDNETRAQVVRLIDDRARQLVPSAARRVISDWTQTTLAAHRGNASRSDTVSARREVEPATTQGHRQRDLPAAEAGASPAALSSRAAQTRSGADPHRNALRSDARRLDYRKLSDEQILDL